GAGRALDLVERRTGVRPVQRDLDDIRMPGELIAIRLLFALHNVTIAPRVSADQHPKMLWCGPRDWTDDRPRGARDRQNEVDRPLRCRPMASKGGGAGSIVEDWLAARRCSSGVVVLLLRRVEPYDARVTLAS